jgi:hypothetical protein
VRRGDDERLFKCGGTWWLLSDAPLSVACVVVCAL